MLKKVFLICLVGLLSAYTPSKHHTWITSQNVTAVSMNLSMETMLKAITETSTNYVVKTMSVTDRLNSNTKNITIPIDVTGSVYIQIPQSFGGCTIGKVTFNASTVQQSLSVLSRDFTSTQNPDIAYASQAISTLNVDLELSNTKEYFLLILTSADIKSVSVELHNLQVKRAGPLYVGSVANYTTGLKLKFSDTFTRTDNILDPGNGWTATILSGGATTPYYGIAGNALDFGGYNVEQPFDIGTTIYRNLEDYSLTRYPIEFTFTFTPCVWLNGGYESGNFHYITYGGTSNGNGDGAGVQIDRYGWMSVRNGGTNLGTISTAFTGGVTYGIRVRIESTQIKVRKWAASGAEPEAWDITYTTTPAFTGNCFTWRGRASGTSGNNNYMDDLFIYETY